MRSCLLLLLLCSCCWAAPPAYLPLVVSVDLQVGTWSSTRVALVWDQASGSWLGQSPAGAVNCVLGVDLETVDVQLASVSVGSASWAAGPLGHGVAGAGFWLSPFEVDYGYGWDVERIGVAFGGGFAGAMSIHMCLSVVTYLAREMLYAFRQAV